MARRLRRGLADFFGFFEVFDFFEVFGFFFVSFEVFGFFFVSFEVGCHTTGGLAIESQGV